MKLNVTKMLIKPKFISQHLINRSTRWFSRKIEFRNNSDHLEVSFPNQDSKFRFSAHWLRINCHSPVSKQQNSGQRIIDVNKIPDKLVIDKVERTKDAQKLIIKWKAEDQQPDTVIPVEFLIDHSTPESTPKLEACKQIEFFDYSKMVDGREAREEVFEWLRVLAKYGLSVVKNVPCRENMVKKVAEIIGPVQTTIYGDIFDVKVDENPINIAYSNAPLELHIDLAYYESPPGVQFLHCLKFDDSIEGGESIFLDALEAADQFRDQNPKEFDTLTRIPATFQKVHLDRARPVIMSYRRPHIVLDARGQVSAVNWSPPFEGPLTGVDYQQTCEFYPAYIKFAKFLNNHPNVIEYRLKPGEVVCFNNRRVLHGRKGFVNSRKGIRHFQGCYLNIDEFKSEASVREFLAKYQGLSSVSLGKIDSQKFKYGNQDCS